MDTPEAPVLTKICSKCPEGQNVKPLTAFYKKKELHLGVMSMCKDCFNARGQDIPAEKYCPGCETTKPGSEFYKKKGNIDGLRRVCKTCVDTPVESLPAEKPCTQCSATKAIEEFAFLSKARGTRQARCKSCMRENTAVWLLLPGNREKTRVWAVEQRVRNEDNEEWHAYLRQKISEWGKANPEKRRAIEHRYRANKRSGGIIDDVEVEVLYIRDKGMCSICLKHVDKRLKFPDPMSASIEHIIPVSKPGSTHSYRNTALAHLICNIRKNNRTVPQQMRLF